LLREFPKIRRAALAGEDVIVQTREGNLRISSEKPQMRSLLGALKGQVVYVDKGMELDSPTSSEQEWDTSL